MGRRPVRCAASSVTRSAHRISGRTRHASQPRSVSASASIVQFLDARLPETASAETVAGLVAALASASPLGGLAVHELRPASRAAIADRLAAFLQELPRRGPFDFGDCSVGNLVFAGSYLRPVATSTPPSTTTARCSACRPALIENVTDGTNAFLVALDDDGRVLGSEEEIVDAKRRNRVAGHLPDRSAARPRRARGARGEGRRECRRRLAGARGPAPLNPRLAATIAEARPDHLRARHAALEPVPVVPHAGPERRDRGATCARSSCSSRTSRPTPRSPAAAPSTSSTAPSST